MISTEWMEWMSHMNWKDTKQQPCTSGQGNILGCCLVSLCFLCDIHSIHSVGRLCSQGWSDIGYSFLIGGDGRVYEGRGWGRVGAHTYGYNSRAYGIRYQLLR